MRVGFRRRRHMLVIGDSVVSRAEPAFAALRRWTVHVDAQPCRQATDRVDGCGATDIPSALDALRDGLGQTAPHVVVFHIGHNGRVRPDQFDRIMSEIPPAATAAWLTLNEPREWEHPNNLDIAAGVRRWPGSVLIDWKSHSTGKPWFEPDDLHVTRQGAKELVSLIDRDLRRHRQRLAGP